MLTRLKLTRGEGQLVEPSSQLSRRRTTQSPQASRRHSPSMAHEESHETLTSEDETFRKDFYDMNSTSFTSIFQLFYHSQPPPKFPKEHGKIPPQTPLLKLDIKFEFPMYNAEVNVEKLDNWIRWIKVYCRIQRIKDDETKIHLASLRLESAALIWWEAKTRGHEETW
jgi:hypothetical protein